MLIVAVAANVIFSALSPTAVRTPIDETFLKIKVVVIAQIMFGPDGDVAIPE